VSDDGSTSHSVTINLVHGDAIRFRVTLPEWRLLGLGGDIEEAQQRNVMAVELDGKLILIPYSNIRSIEVDPAPSELPKHLLRGAKSA
jgi:hypothetical protein